MGNGLLTERTLLYDSGGAVPRFETRAVAKNIVFFYAVMLCSVLLLAFFELKEGQERTFLRDSLILYLVLSGVFFVFITGFRFRLAHEIIHDFQVFTTGIMAKGDFAPWTRIEYLLEVGVDYHQRSVATIDTTEHGIIYEVKLAEQHRPQKIWIPMQKAIELDDLAAWKEHIMLGRDQKIHHGEATLERPIYSRHHVERAVLDQFLSVLTMILLIILLFYILTGALDQALGLTESTRTGAMVFVVIVLSLHLLHLSRIRGERMLHVQPG